MRKAILQGALALSRQGGFLALPRPGRPPAAVGPAGQADSLGCTPADPWLAHVGCMRRHASG
jgi:hypothetical protein